SSWKWMSWHKTSCISFRQKDLPSLRRTSPRPAAALQGRNPRSARRSKDEAQRIGNPGRSGKLAPIHLDRSQGPPYSPAGSHPSAFLSIEFPPPVISISADDRR